MVNFCFTGSGTSTYLFKDTVDNFTTESGLRTAIASEKNPEVRDALNTYLNAIVGKPQYDASSVMNRGIDMAKNFSYILLLKSSLSMGYEVLKASSTVLSNSHSFSQGIKEIRNILKDIPDTSELLHELIYTVGSGGGETVSRDLHFKGFDMNTNTSDYTEGVIKNTGLAVKGASLWCNKNWRQRLRRLRQGSGSWRMSRKYRS